VARSGAYGSPGAAAEPCEPGFSPAARNASACTLVCTTLTDQQDVQRGAAARSRRLGHAMSDQGIAMRAKVIADAELKKQYWLERACCVTERQSRKMSTAIQDELDKEGMFDLCLAFLKRSANGGLWSYFLLCAELLEKGKLFFIDIEGRRKIGVWEVSIITKGSQWTRLMNPLAGASTLNDSRKLCEERFGHPTIFRTAYEAFVGVPLPPGTNHTCALALDRLHEAVLKSKTHKELTPEILAATAGCDAGIHYAGDKNKWMLESVGYKGSMVDLYQMILRFFAILWRTANSRSRMRAWL